MDGWMDSKSVLGTWLVDRSILGMGTFVHTLANG